MDDRVTVGMPVRNGGLLLSRALDSVMTQSHENLHIVISDNGSTDQTPDICAAAAQQDRRITFVRQDPPVSAIKNFEFTLRQATTPYFMWAAHDDLRGPNYVETLLQRLRHSPSASLAMGRVLLFDDHDSAENAALLEYRCATEGIGPLRLLLRRSRCRCFEIYGLFRTQALTACKFYDYSFGSDWPIVNHALVQGELVQTEDTDFLYYDRRVPVTERGPLESGFESSTIASSARLAALLLRSGVHAYRSSTHRHRGTLAVSVTSGSLLRLGQDVTYACAPEKTRAAWARWRSCHPVVTTPSLPPTPGH